MSYQLLELHGANEPENWTEYLKGVAQSLDKQGRKLVKLRYTLPIFTLILMMLSIRAYSVDDPEIFSFTIAPQGDRFSVIGKLGKFILIDNSTFERVQFITFPKQHVRFKSAALSSKDQWLALGASDGSVLLYEVSKLWDVRETAWAKLPRLLLNEHNNEIWAVAFSPNGEKLASGGAEGILKLSYITTSTSKRKSSILLEDASRSAIKVITFSPDGRILAVGRKDGTIAIWDVETRHVRNRYRDDSAEVTALAFSSNNKILAFGTTLSELMLWDVSRYNELTSLEGHEGNIGAINTLAFSLGGEVLASGGADRKVVLWNTQTGKKISEHSSENSVLSVIFTVDGQKLIVGDTVGEIKRMNTDIPRANPRSNPNPDVVSKEQQNASATTSQTGGGSKEEKQALRTTTRLEITDRTPPAFLYPRYPKEIIPTQNTADIYVRVIDGESGVKNVKIDDVEMLSNSGNSFQHTVSLKEGINDFTMIATDNAGNTSNKTIRIFRRLAPPKIEVINPQLDANNSAEIRRDEVEIKVKVTDESQIAEVKCNNKEMVYRSTVDGGGIYSLTFIYHQRGPVTFIITAKDTMGSMEAKQKITVTALAGKTPPRIEVINPRLNKNTAIISGDSFRVTARVTDESGITEVKINGIKAITEDGERFTANINRTPRLKTVTIRAKDKSEETSKLSFTVDFQNPQRSTSKATPDGKPDKPTGFTRTLVSPVPNQTVPSTPSNQKEEDDPRIIFDDPDLSLGRDHETRETSFLLRVYVIDASQVQVRVERKVNGWYERVIDVPQVEKEKRTYAENLPLNEGPNEFRIIAEDEWGNIESQLFTIVRPRIDNEGPAIQVFGVGDQRIHSEGMLITVQQTDVHIRGRVSDTSGIRSVAINSTPVTVDENGFFGENIRLDYGKNSITVYATDGQNYISKFPFTITCWYDRIGKDFALLFATDTYTGKKDEDGNWKDLTGAIKDVEVVAKKLREDYGFETRIFKNLPKIELTKKLFEYRKNFDGAEYAPDSQLLLFFSGHGYFHDPDPTDDETGEGYLITADTYSYKEDPWLNTALKYEELREVIDGIACQHILVLLDTSFSGTFDPAFKKSQPFSFFKGPINGSQLEQVTKVLEAKARWCLTAAGAELVISGNENLYSPFVLAFLNALDSKGGNDFLLTLEEVWEKIEKSKNNPTYDKVIKEEKELRRRDVLRPEPWRGQFGKSDPQSDFLFFPIK